MSHSTINALELTVNERQRKEFKDRPLLDLAESILRVGLIHAPVITGDGTLVAGERRLRALALTEASGSFQYAGETFTYPNIPVHVIPANSSPKLIFEIELEENIRRVNLTPMEEANAIAALHQLRLEDFPQQTRKDTAQELATLEGREEVSLGDQIRVANAIIVDQFKDDPEVQKAAKVSLSKAAKVAKKKMETDLLLALSGAEKSAASGMFSIYPGSCLEIMPTLPDASFDVLLYDPPYGVNADRFGEQASDLGHQYKDDWETAKNLITSIISESTRILKPNAHVLMFCPFETFSYWKNVYGDFGFKVWPRPIIWSKGQQSHAPVPDYGPRYSYECILFAMRGQRKINKLINDVISIPSVRDKSHAAEKPAELLAELIDFVGRPGISFLDPTCGSGSIFLGAKGKEVYVVGIELDPRAFATARERTK